MRISFTPPLQLRAFIISSLCLFIALGSYSQTTSSVSIQQISGLVVNTDGEPVQFANVNIKDSFIATQTDEHGKFSIKAASDDVLVVSAFIMKTKEVRVDMQDFIEIVLQTNVELLDEVFLSQKKKEEKEEYYVSPFGKQKEASIGYAKRTIESKDFLPGAINMQEMLAWHPLTVGNPNGGKLFFTRNLRGAINPTPFLVILDGAPMDQSILLTLDVALVESVTLVPGLFGNIKYGQLGNGGAVYIRTKLQADFDDAQEEIPSLEVTNNEYTDTPILLESISESAVIEELKASATLTEAKQAYQKHTAAIGMRSLEYYLEAAEYFSDRDMLYSHQIMSKLIKLCADNPNIMKRLAYQCEQLGRFHQAAYIYEELMEMHPDRVQSYLDLAEIYVEAGNYKTANALYRQMLFNTVPNLDFTEVESIVIAEYRRFLSKFRSDKINFDGLPNEILIPFKKPTVRIVFEWTNPLSQFEVQFVSPAKRYFNWKHTTFDYKDEIEKELKDGYSVKEFVIDDPEKGGWIVNITPKENEVENLPSFVKYTVYKNYGMPNETKEVKVVSLDEVSEKVTLDAILD